jgi:SepF-like predicted cell division protein (DUF552 family)
MSITAGTAAGILQIIAIVQAAANAAPIIAKIKEMGAQGASFEQILEAVRNMAAASEADAQAAINKG